MFAAGHFRGAGGCQKSPREVRFQECKSRERKSKIYKKKKFGIEKQKCQNRLLDNHAHLINTFCYCGKLCIYKLQNVPKALDDQNDRISLERHSKVLGEETSGNHQAYRRHTATVLFLCQSIDYCYCNLLNSS